MTPARPTIAGEVGGAFGDLGTLLPILLGAVAVAGMPAGGVLVGFGAFLLATGLVYRLPLPVQPMKAVGALIVAGGLAPGEVAAAGMAGGLILLALTLGSATAWAARVVPRSAVLGLQLGVGTTMAWIGLGLAWGGPLAAGVALVLLLALPHLAPRLPAVPIALAGAVVVDLAAGGALPPLPSPSFAPPASCCRRASRKPGAALSSARCRSSRSPSPTPSSCPRCWRARCSRPPRHRAPRSGASGSSPAPRTPSSPRSGRCQCVTGREA